MWGPQAGEFQAGELQAGKLQAEELRAEFRGCIGLACA